MRYGTGLKDGEDSGLCADITGADVLATLVARTWSDHELVVTSCDADGMAIPEYLKQYGTVVGSLTLQNVDGTKVLDEVTYMIDDAYELTDEDKLLVKMLEINSAGSGEYCQILAVMEGPSEVRVSYWKHDSEGLPLGEL
jgi:hypothetical protein